MGDGEQVAVRCMITVFGIVVMILVLGAARHYWAKFRRFQGELFIENMRLWRELVEEYRRLHPEEKTNISVDNEAVYLLQHSNMRKGVNQIAWNNVRSGKRENPLLEAQRKIDAQRNISN